MSDAALAFLGWDRSPLGAAVEWVAEELGFALEGWTFALPGQQAARRLEELLAREALARGCALVPPTVRTAGVLSDALLELEGARADGLTRALAWERALREVGPATVGRLVRQVPAADDGRGWRALAQTVRRLHGDLAAQGLEPRSVCEAEAVRTRPDELRRWEALTEVRAAYDRVLATTGAVDPHVARMAALRGERAAAVGERVLLIGVVEANRLLRKALELHLRQGGEVRALVFAPETERAGFDALGCVRPAHWTERRHALPLGRWTVVEQQADQARALVSVLAQGDERDAGRITVGVPDPQAVPYLQAALEEHGVVGRPAEGRALTETPVGRLLEATAAFLEGGGARELASLWRHAQVERALLAPDADGTPPATLLDLYLPECLPTRVDGTWLATGSSFVQRRLDGRLAPTWERFVQLLGELHGEARRPLGGWADPIAAFLERVLDDGAGAPARELAGGLRAVAEGLEALRHLPAELQGSVPAAEALGLLLHGLRGERGAPPAVDPGVPTLELRGWLELPLDDAPELVVTGMVEGRVPETPSPDPFLPEGLRRELGLSHDGTRLGRDAYLVELLQRSRDTHWITPRRSAEGDPMRPSRLCLRAEPEELPQAVLHWIGDGAGAPPAAPKAPKPTPLSVFEDPRGRETYSVTSFGKYLNAPRLFHVERQLGLEGRDDGQAELDAARFGTLAHEVLEGLVDPHLAQQRDPEVLREALEARLADVARRRFGHGSLPAVELQVERLRYRLGLFARAQAARAAEGWSVVAVEWAPERDAQGSSGVPLDVDGTRAWLTGRIDRVDRHAGTGQVALWDYKTGSKRPGFVHRGRDGTWRDLQLPLYAELAASWLEPGGPPPLLGYANLGKDESEVGFWVLDADDAYLREALEEARRIVREVRAGTRLAQRDVRDTRFLTPVQRALVGLGLAGEAEEEDDA